MRKYLSNVEPMTEREREDLDQLAFLEEYRKKQEKKEKKAEAKRLRAEEKANQKQKRKERRRLWWKKMTGRL